MGFDLTSFLLELLNFAVLLWILRRLVYTPLRDAIQSRRQAIEQQRLEVARGREEIERRTGEVEGRLAELDRVRGEMVARGREEAAAEAARILLQAREDATSERERVQQLLARERGELHAQMRDATVANGVELAGRVLLELAPEALDRALLERVLAAATDADPERLQAARGSSVELRLAHSLSEDEQKSLRSRLEKTLGARSVEICIDPALGAGGVLRLGDQVLDGSLSGQLQLLRDRARALLEGLGPSEDAVDVSGAQSMAPHEPSGARGHG